MSSTYQDIKISAKEAESIFSKLFGMQGKAALLPGELDFNFKIKTPDRMVLMKISRPDTDAAYLEFQQAILQHVAESDVEIVSPVPLPTCRGILSANMPILPERYARSDC